MFATSRTASGICLVEATSRPYSANRLIGSFIATAQPPLPSICWLEGPISEQSGAIDACLRGVAIGVATAVERVVFRIFVSNRRSLRLSARLIINQTVRDGARHRRCLEIPDFGVQPSIPTRRSLSFHPLACLRSKPGATA